MLEDFLLLGKLGFFGIIGLALFVVVSQTGGNAAQATVSQSCFSGADGGVTVAFVWPAPGEGATETWLDLGFGTQFDATTSQGYSCIHTPRSRLRSARGWLRTSPSQAISR